MGILIVRDMLITGFDAPVEQIMYLDKVVIAHNLLQAIARVNRVAGEAKDKGFVVDYIGINVVLVTTNVTQKNSMEGTRPKELLA